MQPTIINRMPFGNCGKQLWIILSSKSVGKLELWVKSQMNQPVLFNHLPWYIFWPGLSPFMHIFRSYTTTVLSRFNEGFSLLYFRPKYNDLLQSIQSTLKISSVLAHPLCRSWCYIWTVRWTDRVIPIFA